MKKVFCLLIVFVISFNTWGNSQLNNIDNKVFLLPEEAKQAKNTVIKLIENSQSSIVIAMYNFSYRKFAKQLVKAAQKGVKVTVLLDKKNKTKNKKIYNLLEEANQAGANNIQIKTVDKKMHLKVAIFDQVKMIVGSANWTKKSFKDNYELLMLIDDKEKIQKISQFILSL